ncbi:unnamed protein product [Chironomus riparius]|uniref:Uncharacterized protein n=1 Tax=Chironomus riparius TaxID=315576 RepID=A0A9N9WN71_9DIPT|nr:unnamed protein product [Chironomus riparius]
MDTRNCDIFKHFEKEEYELNLFGFAIKDFKFENLEFFWKKQVNKSMQTISKRFMDLMNKGKLEAVENVKSSINQIEQFIIKSTESNIQHIVNMEVEKALNIPENVILPTDRAQLKLDPYEEIYDLEQECDNLGNILIQNAIFLKHLNNELNSYELDWLDKEDQICLRGQHFLNIQLFDTDFLNRYLIPKNSK